MERVVFELDERLLDKFLYSSEHYQFPCATKRQRYSICSSPGSPTDSMHIVFGIVGQIVINNMGNAFHINTSCDNIRTDKDFYSTAIKCCKSTLSCLLSLV